MWAKLHRLVLGGLGSRGELDWSRCVIDSVNLRALKRGTWQARILFDRGKHGSKIHLITKRMGLPLSLGMSGTNLHDSQAPIPLVKRIPPIRSRRRAAQAPRRRGLRLLSPAVMDTRAWHQAPPRLYPHLLSAARLLMWLCSSFIARSWP